ncbi:MAG: potassium/proton antiporter [Nitriliruptor sp.]|uniref:potassium/proton antiporter n=1 Tax=Nitriliruptor sp. TaxID=2448056 RepID=UPI0034A0866D
MSDGLPVDPVVLIAAVLLAFAVLVAGVTRRVQTPSALLFLGIGMLVGDDGLAIIQLSDPSVVQNLGVVALLVILFDGGLTTKPTDLRRAAGPASLLATVGVLLTSAITAFGVWLLLDVEVATAALIGAVVGSTDAAAVFAMLRGIRLPRRLAAILKVESGANDPIAIVITLTVVEFAVGGADTANVLQLALLQPVVGIAVGGGIGMLGVVVLRRVRLSADALYPVLALAVAGVAYGLAAMLGGSGFFAVYLAGVLVGAKVDRRRRSIRDFHEGLANVAEIGLFLMLGLLVFPTQLPGVAAAGLLVAVLLTFVARPITVLLCLLPFRLPPREQAVLGWGGLRGAVPIVLATFPITAGYEDALYVFDIVFFVVLVSILLQGTTITKVIEWLGVTSSRRAWAPVAEALPLDDVDADLVEAMLTDDLLVAGRWLRDVPLPSGMLLVAIARDEQVVVPRGDTVLLSGDVLMIIAEDPRRAADRITAWARGEGDIAVDRARPEPPAVPDG